MQGKICLVTGATHGIGRETALALAGLGATVVLVGRSPEKTGAAASVPKPAAPPSITCWLTCLPASRFTGW